MALCLRYLALSILIAAVWGQIAPTAQAGPAFALTSTSIELPAGDTPFPAGPGVETVTANCLTCHSAGMILNQPALKKAVWDAEVRKMIGVFKAPVADADVATIVDYLAATKGAK